MIALLVILFQGPRRDSGSARAKKMPKKITQKQIFGKTSRQSTISENVGGHGPLTPPPCRGTCLYKFIINQYEPITSNACC